MTFQSPERAWSRSFKRVAQSLSNQPLPKEIATEVISGLKERREEGNDVNIADMTASLIITDGETLQEVWEEIVQPGLVEVARSYGSAGIIVRITRSYLDNPDIARQGARHAAPFFISLQVNTDQPVFDISKSAFRKGLESLEADPSGFSLIRMVHNPDFFAIKKRVDPHYEITNALIRYGFSRYQRVYRQLENLEKAPVQGK